MVVAAVGESLYSKSSSNPRCLPCTLRRVIGALPAFTELMQTHTISLFQLQHSKCMHGVVDSCHNLSSLKHL